MTGMERNSDIVVMSSYAPLLTNVNPGGSQWDTDLIGYDAMRSYGSPSYYAQVLFSGHHGDEILNASMPETPVRLFESVTRDTETGTIYLKLVNATDMARTVQVQLLHHGHAAAGPAKMYVLTAASTEATNSIGDPEHIVPAECSLRPLGSEFALPLAPLSINVVELPMSH